jgi:hypothetical protein
VEKDHSGISSKSLIISKLDHQKVEYGLPDMFSKLLANLTG